MFSNKGSLSLEKKQEAMTWYNLFELIALSVVCVNNSFNDSKRICFVQSARSPYAYILGGKPFPLTAKVKIGDTLIAIIQDKINTIVNR